jgi:stage V sporulation protein D (sporulation-specific penicillin-binding protein)
MPANLIRALGIVLVSLALFSYLIYCLFKLQILNHDTYSERREKQNQFTREENKRGTIYGTRKDGELVALALDDTWYRLVLSPRDIDPAYESRLYSLLSAITPLEEEAFLAKLKNKRDIYEEIKIINKEEAEAIEKLAIQGVFTYKTFKRRYPLANIGGRVIGFVGGGADNKFIGRYGLERQYEDDLTATGNLRTTFFSKIFSSDEDAVDSDYAKNIVTTLEPNVMKFLNATLLDMEGNWGADEVSAIVMNPKTGEIIAMETVPGFDPNNFSLSNIKYFGNPSVQGVYELGSIMKPITLSGGIEEGLITPSTVFHDYGFVKVDNYTIKNFDEKVRGDVTMQDVISQSLNTGAVYVSKLLGHEKFKRNFENFGLDDQTGIDFPGEVINQTENLDTNTDVNFATAAFGQGVAITPISMLSSLSIIANEGLSMCPHFLVSKTLQDGSQIYYECSKEPKQAVSTTTAETMKKMMVELIDTGLANGRYKDKNYTVGAKTGTAQLPSPDGKYYKDKFIHSYFTFFPSNDPQFAVLLYQVNPKRGLLASLTLAPYASKVKDFLLTYYNIPPDRE